LTFDTGFATLLEQKNIVSFDEEEYLLQDLVREPAESASR